MPETERTKSRLPDNFNEFSDTENIKTSIHLDRLPDGEENCGDSSSGGGLNEDERPTPSPGPPPSNDRSSQSNEEEYSCRFGNETGSSKEECEKLNEKYETCLEGVSNSRKLGHQNLFKNIESQTKIQFLSRAENTNFSVGAVTVNLKKPEIECIARHGAVLEIYAQTEQDPINETRILRFHEIEAPETVSVSAESFMIRLKNTCYNRENQVDNCEQEDYIQCYEEFSWDVMKTANQIGLTAKASSTLKPGDNICDGFSTLGAGDYEINGPFQVGNFKIVLHQPDGSTVEKVVKITE